MKKGNETCTQCGYAYERRGAPTHINPSTANTLKKQRTREKTLTGMPQIAGFWKGWPKTSASFALPQVKGIVKPPKDKVQKLQVNEDGYY